MMIRYVYTDYDNVQPTYVDNQESETLRNVFLLPQVCQLNSFYTYLYVDTCTMKQYTYKYISDKKMNKSHDVYICNEKYEKFL